MSIEQLIALLRAELEDDLVGMVSVEDDTLVLSFTDGTQRKITVS